jgi:hypothetical protein
MTFDILRVIVIAWQLGGVAAFIYFIWEYIL